MQITDILDTLGIEYRGGGSHSKVTANYTGIDCPYCSAGTGKFKLGYSNSTGYCTCWSCGPKNITHALAEITGKPYKQIRGMLKEVGVSRYVDTPRNGLKLPPGLGPLLPQHKAYLKRRKIDPDTSERLWGLQGIGMDGRLKWRVFLPIHDNGKIASWTTRTIGKGNPRYVAADASEEAVSAKACLFGDRLARNAVLVVEGGMDAIRLGPGAVATMGMSYTKTQVNKIARYPTRAIIFDHSVSAQKRAIRLCSALESMPGKTYRIEIDSDDPGEATDKEINLIRRTVLHE